MVWSALQLTEVIHPLLQLDLDYMAVIKAENLHVWMTIMQGDSIECQDLRDPRFIATLMHFLFQHIKSIQHLMNHEQAVLL